MCNAVMCLSVVSRGDGVSSVSVTDGDKSSSCHAISSLDVTENTCTPRGYFCVYVFVCKYPADTQWMLIFLILSFTPPHDPSWGDKNENFIQVYRPAGQVFCRRTFTLSITPGKKLTWQFVLSNWTFYGFICYTLLSYFINLLKVLQTCDKRQEDYSWVTCLCVLRTPTQEEGM